MAEGNFPGLPQITDKNFWTRPEGTAGKIAAGALVVGAGVATVAFLPAVLAYIAGILASTLSIALHGLGLFAIGYLLLNDDFRNLLGYAFRSGIRWLTGFVVDISPIAVVRDYVDELKKRLRNMSTQIEALKRQITSLQQLIKRNATESEQSLQRLAVAKKQGKSLVGLKETRLVGRLNQSNLTLTELHKKMEMVYRVLIKMHENCDVSIQMTEQDVDIAIREATALSAGSEAVKNAMKIINGDPSKKKMFDMAMGRLAQTTSDAVAEIDHFMEMSKSFFDSVDLQNGVFDDQALKQLEAWEKRIDSSVLGPGGKQALLDAANDPSQVLDLEHPSLQPTKLGPSDVSDYFK